MFSKRSMTFVMLIALLGLVFGTMGIGTTQAAELWHYWLSGGEKEALNSLVDSFKAAYPADTIKESGIPGNTPELRRQLSAAFMANKPPELYQSSVGFDLKSYVDAGRLSPIDDIWAAVNGNKIFPKGLRNMVYFNGHPWAIPLNMHVISHIFYNKHLFDKYGLKPPKDWNEYNKISKILRSKGIEPMAASKDLGVYPFYAPLVTVLGPDGYLKLGMGQIAFTDAKVRKAFLLFKDSLVSSYMKGWAGYGWAEAANPFFKGQVAMYMSGDWAVALFQERGWKPGSDFDFFPAPGTQNVEIIQVDAIAAPKGSKDLKGTHDFLTYCAGVDGQKAFNKYKGSVAANLHVDPLIYNPTMKKTYDRIQQISKDGEVLPNLAYSMLPQSFGEELVRQVARYALSPDNATLNSVLKILEKTRKRLVKEKKFVDWTI
jgi:glucose/mannose transport system substrate-binding protein